MLCKQQEEYKYTAKRIKRLKIDFEKPIFIDITIKNRGL